MSLRGRGARGRQSAGGAPSTTFKEKTRATGGCSRKGGGMKRSRSKLIVGRTDAGTPEPKVGCKEEA